MYMSVCIYIYIYMHIRVQNSTSSSVSAGQSVNYVSTTIIEIFKLSQSEGRVKTTIFAKPIPYSSSRAPARITSVCAVPTGDVQYSCASSRSRSCSPPPPLHLLSSLPAFHVALKMTLHIHHDKYRYTGVHLHAHSLRIVAA